MAVQLEKIASFDYLYGRKKLLLPVNRQFMRTILFCICLCFFFNGAIAQMVSLSKTAANGAAYNIYDINGRPFKNTDYNDVSGTPFLNDAWRPAELALTDGRKMSGVNVRINAFTNEVHFLTTNNDEFATPSGLVRSIKFADSTQQPGVVIVYQCGFPAVDYQKTESFYEVISAGKLPFLKSFTKNIDERRNELSGERSRQFQTYEILYVFQNGAMKRLKKDKSFVLEMMADQKEKVDAYITSEKINFKSVESLKKLFDFYNGIEK
jgi:hypothetical protein